MLNNLVSKISPLYIIKKYKAINVIYDNNSIIFLFLDLDVIIAIKYPNRHDNIVGIKLTNNINIKIVIIILKDKSLLVMYMYKPGNITSKEIKKLNNNKLVNLFNNIIFFFIGKENNRLLSLLSNKAFFAVNIVKKKERKLTIMNKNIK